MCLSLDDQDLAQGTLLVDSLAMLLSLAGQDREPEKLWVILLAVSSSVAGRGHAKATVERTRRCGLDREALHYGVWFRNQASQWRMAVFVQVYSVWCQDPE